MLSYSISKHTALRRFDPGGIGPSQIALNQNASLPSQRFTLSHELSHYLLHQNHTQFLCDGCERSPLEWQANEAAAELLLPYRIFLPILSNIR